MRWATTLKEPLSGPWLFACAGQRKDLLKFQGSLRKTVERGVPLSEAWSIPLVMPAQPAQGERRHK